MARIDKPAQKLLLVEANASNTGWNDYASDWWGSGPGGNWSNGFLKGHLDMANYLFCDGHVKSMKAAATVSGGFSMWEFGNDNPAGGSLNYTTAMSTFP